MTTATNNSSKKISPWLGVLLIVVSNLPLLKFLGFEMNPMMNVLSLGLTGSGILILFKGMSQEAGA
jgi:hypothetical protein